MPEDKDKDKEIEKIIEKEVKTRDQKIDEYNESIKDKRNPDGTWKKGVTGNPGGMCRNKNKVLDETLKKILNKSVTIDDDGNLVTNLQRYFDFLFGQAMAGNLAAGQILLNYYYGKPGTITDQTLLPILEQKLKEAGIEI